MLASQESIKVFSGCHRKLHGHLFVFHHRKEKLGLGSTEEQDSGEQENLQPITHENFITLSPKIYSCDS